jgi:hypothetical protein
MLKGKQASGGPKGYNKVEGKITEAMLEHSAFAVVEHRLVDDEKADGRIEAMRAAVRRVQEAA